MFLAAAGKKKNLKLKLHTSQWPSMCSCIIYQQGRMVHADQQHSDPLDVMHDDLK